MKQLIGYCGIDCEKCDAYIATKNNDQSLREKTAKLWSELNNAPILPEHINCEGCRVNGKKTVYCDSLCAIRHCAMEKRVTTCGDCPKMDTCPIVGALHANNPESRQNLINIGNFYKLNDMELNRKLNGELNRKLNRTNAWSSTVLSTLTSTLTSTFTF